MMRIELKVNGTQRAVDVEPGELLLDTLRNRLGLPGTKEYCRQGECGACTILLDGDAVDSCLVLSASVEGRDITTIEGLSSSGKLHPVQEAFISKDGAQCGYCTPGMVLSTKALLDRNPDPTDEQIRMALAGNLCRCTGYKSIVNSVHAAAEQMKGTAES